MRKVGFTRTGRIALGLFLLTLPAFVAGCGDSTGSEATSADAQAKQIAEREARLKYFGKSMLPPGTKKDLENAPKEE